MRAEKIIVQGQDSDGVSRFTRFKNFLLIGGTEKTHARMTSVAIQLEKQLKVTGRRAIDYNRLELNRMIKAAYVTLGLN